ASLGRILQQNRHKADLTALTAGCPLFATKRTHDKEQDKVSFVPILLQKSFPLVTKNSPGCRRDFRVKMWGTSSPDDKLTGDLAEATEATKIAGRRSDRPMAGKLSPRNFGLLQQYLQNQS